MKNPDVMTGIRVVGRALRLSPVEETESGTSYFAKTILGHQIAILVKPVSIGESVLLNVDVKTSEANLSTAIVQDIAHFAQTL